jgi:hypothetical protein
MSRSEAMVSQGAQGRGLPLEQLGLLRGRLRGGSVRREDRTFYFTGFCRETNSGLGDENSPLTSKTLTMAPRFSPGPASFVLTQLVRLKLSPRRRTLVSSALGVCGINRPLLTLFAEGVPGSYQRNRIGGSLTRSRPRIG